MLPLLRSASFPLGFRSLSLVCLSSSALAACGTSDGETDPVLPGMSTTTPTPTSSVPSSTSTNTTSTTGATVNPITTAGPSSTTSPQPTTTTTGTTPSSTDPTSSTPSSAPSTETTQTTPDTSSTTTSTTTDSTSSAPTDTSEPNTGTGSTGGEEGCPAGASFCSGFESPDLPTGAVFKVNGDPATPWTANFEVDSTQKHSGNASLRVRSAAEGVGSYKMLAVPSGGATFWARFYLRSDKELGVHDHNAITIASTSDDPNAGGVEFAEDVGLSFNTQDNVRWPDGYGRLTGGGEMAYTLAANEWHCIELSFDGTGRVQKAYVEGNEFIAADMYPSAAMSFTTFKFGYNALHGTARDLWYDDVVVGPSRAGCL